MSTPGIVGVLKGGQDWSGVYVRYDAYLEGTGTRLIAELNRAGGAIDRVTNQVSSAPQGWRTLLDEPYGNEPSSPMPRGVTPPGVARADPAYIYLFDRAGKLHVLSTPNAKTPLANHSFAGLSGYDLLCSVDLKPVNDPDVLMKSIEPVVLWQAEVASGWGSGAAERKGIVNLLAREATRKNLALEKLRGMCSVQLAELIKQRLGSDSGAVMVRFGESRVCLETDVEGIKVRMMRVNSPAGSLDILSESGRSASIDQTAILSELESAKPELFSAAKVVMTQRSGWLLEILAWLRQSQVPDPIKNYIPLTEFRHSDGRRWGIEIMQVESWPTTTNLTLVITTSDGDVVERNRKFESFDAAKEEREKLIQEMKEDGFQPA